MLEAKIIYKITPILFKNIYYFRIFPYTQYLVEFSFNKYQKYLKGECMNDLSSCQEHWLWKVMDLILNLRSHTGCAVLDKLLYFPQVHFPLCLETWDTQAAVACNPPGLPYSHKRLTKLPSWTHQTQERDAAPTPNTISFCRDCRTASYVWRKFGLILDLDYGRQSPAAVFLGR